MNPKILSEHLGYDTGLADLHRYRREPSLDRRIANGDDFAGDAWRNLETGEIEYTAVGHKREGLTP